MNKYEFTKYLIEENQITVSNLIDVGCRDKILKKYFSTDVNYFGIDVSNEANCDEIVDISQKTRFIDNQFQLLIALDVAEHTDDIYFTVSEMLRIANICIIALPNIYKIGMRLRFMRGYSLCDKYVLSKKNSQSGGYRHRWVFTPVEAISFMKSIATENNYSLKVYYYYPELRGPLKYLKHILPSTLSSEALYFIMQPNN